MTDHTQAITDPEAVLTSYLLAVDAGHELSDRAVQLAVAALAQLAVR